MPHHGDSDSFWDNLGPFPLELIARQLPLRVRKNLLLCCTSWTKDLLKSSLFSHGLLLEVSESCSGCRDQTTMPQVTSKHGDQKSDAGSNP